MAEFQTSEVDEKLASVNVGPLFFMLTDLHRMKKFYFDRFCEKQKSMNTKGG
jgi:hypothetical protein